MRKLLTFFQQIIVAILHMRKLLTIFQHYILIQINTIDFMSTLRLNRPLTNDFVKLTRL